MALLTVWAFLLPLYGMLLWAAIGKGGPRAWPKPEPRLAVILAAAFLLLIAAGDVRSLGLNGIGPALFWLLFAGWLVRLQDLCPRAAR